MVYTVFRNQNVSLLMHSSLSTGGGSTGLTFSESISIDTIEGRVDIVIGMTVAVTVITGIDGSSSPHSRTSIHWTGGSCVDMSINWTGVGSGGYAGSL